MSGKPHWIVGRHVVEEALVATGRKVIQVLVFEGDRERYSELVGKARAAGARVRYVQRGELDRAADGAAHQGLAAQVFNKVVGGFAEFMGGLSEAQKKSALIVALDEIQDPHNFGAIARSAVCLGAMAIITPERRSAPITQTVLQASAGAIQLIPTYAVGNLAQTILKLKEQGFWPHQDLLRRAGLHPPRPGRRRKPQRLLRRQRPALRSRPAKSPWLKAGRTRSVAPTGARTPAPRAPSGPPSS
ncbi:MAG: 23S rRNA (guanosine2251-2'-O)-methyltransferase [Elusimicrobia bacterium]|nr:MAG: 23S rRNA (guanosine2251-2'-O)-methyltransferase [Elusimicrobiota bacterium]